MSKQITVTLKGNNYKCDFGLGFLGNVIEQLDTGIYELAEKVEKNPFLWLPRLMYHSIKYSNENIEFSEKDLIQMIDDTPNGFNECGKFNTAFIKSLNPNLPQEVIEDANEPKKK